jgi:RecA/RadA recombinase
VARAALFIKFEEAEGKTEVALEAAAGAAAEVLAAGSGYEATRRAPKFVAVDRSAAWRAAQGQCAPPPQAFRH